jgi:molybdopterin-containing oxidoreductase family iron-sulfur binding subunit
MSPGTEKDQGKVDMERPGVRQKKREQGQKGKQPQAERRALLQKVLVGAAAAMCAPLAFQRNAGASTPDAGKDTARPLDAPKGLVEGNILERMRHDLLRAMKKQVSERKWVMIIDQQKCIGCCACNLSCNTENNLPPGVVYRPVLRQEVGKYPNVRRIFTPKPCMHCDNPPCVPVCPVKATWKREDGTVVVDYDICIGCRNCLQACPYSARTADFGDFYGMGTPEIMPYETRPNYEYSKEWRRKPHSDDSPVGNARKCQFCLHRLREGMLPACVTTCLGGATYFGDYNDKSSLVHKLLGSSRVRQLKPELGTRPSVFYLT